MKNKTFGNIIESEPLYITTPKLNNDGEIEYKGEKPIYENSKNFNRFHNINSSLSCHIIYPISLGVYTEFL